MVLRELVPAPNLPSPLLFVEKPSSVQILDRSEVLQKDKPVTVRAAFPSVFCWSKLRILPV